jgi:hypothetical protein
MNAETQADNERRSEQARRQRAASMQGGRAG